MNAFHLLADDGKINTSTKRGPYSSFTTPPPSFGIVKMSWTAFYTVDTMYEVGIRYCNNRDFSHNGLQLRHSARMRRLNTRHRHHKNEQEEKKETKTREETRRSKTKHRCEPRRLHKQCYPPPSLGKKKILRSSRHLIYPPNYLPTHPSPVPSHDTRLYRNALTVPLPYIFIFDLRRKRGR